LEVVEHTLSLTNLKTLSNVSQTSHALNTYIRNNVSLWKSFFAKFFDLPEERHQSISWRSKLQSHIQAKHTILGFFSAHVPPVEELRNALEVLIQTARSAPPGHGRSKNVVWLNGILTDPVLWPSNFPLTSSLPRLNQHFQLQSALQVLNCDDVGSPGDRLEARAFVWDMRNYRRSSHFGPFVPRSSEIEPFQINYIHVRYLINVLVPGPLTFFLSSKPRDVFTKEFPEVVDPIFVVEFNVFASEDPPQRIFTYVPLRRSEVEDVTFEVASCSGVVVTLNGWTQARSRCFTGAR